MKKKDTENTQKRFSLIRQLQADFFYSTSIDSMQLQKTKCLILHENITRLVLMFVLIVSIQVYCFFSWLCLSNKSSAFAWNMILLYLVLALYICVALFTRQILNEKMKSTLFQTIIINVFWITFSLHSQLLIFAEISNRQSIYLFLLLTVLYSTVPLFSFVQAVSITILNGTITCSMIFLITKESYLFQIAVFSCLLALTVSRRFYSIFLKTAVHKNELTVLTETDPLTQLLNRRGIGNKIEIMQTRCAESHKNMAVIMIDVDDFKLYNDTYGHDKGDQCLTIISNCIKKSTEPFTCIVGRYGGEEILIVIENIQTDELLKLSHKIINNVEKLNITAGIGAKHQNVTISIGVHSYLPTKAPQFRLAVELADKQLYIAKNNGRNCISHNGNINHTENSTTIG